jgi:adenine C2-methylase RlmN of 23S rRNA A2503 and tRNA A37
MNGGILTKATDGDGTTKLLIGLGGGNLIETTLLRLDRSTSNVICVSTQVGCAFRCAFCANGALPLFRNLEATEIVNQVELALAERPDYEQSFDVSFMGAGEPLANFNAVLSSMRILRAEFAGLRTLNISTVGPMKAVSRLEVLATEAPVHLQWSLHNPFDDERSAMMGQGMAPVATMKQAVSVFAEASDDEVCVNYLLLRGWNETERHCSALIALLREMNVYVKLSSCSGHSSEGIEGADLDRVGRFSAALVAAGIRVKHFTSSGVGIGAGCGQMISRRLKD